MPLLQLSPSMCLQVMGSVEPAAKVVLWNESRQPIQNWSAKMQGPIGSLTFPGMVLDVKGEAGRVGATQSGYRTRYIYSHFE